MSYSSKIGVGFVCAQDYWDDVAKEYDNLYTDPYSLLEDSLVGEFLSTAMPKHAVDVLEVGCGTGLSLEIYRSLKSANYLGIDKSFEMISAARRKHDVAFEVMDASELDRLGRNFDFIFSINGVMSYLDDPLSTLITVKKVLRFGGKCHLSFLNRFALRRIVRFSLGRTEPLGTRGTTKRDSSSVQNLYSEWDIIKLSRSAGFKVTRIDRYGLFSGLNQSERSFKLGVNPLLRKLPLTHTINVTMEHDE